MTRKWTWALLILASIYLPICSVRNYLPITPTELLGFITGAVCVLLIVEQNIWNFPIGIANNVFFIILFLSARLYGDMALQVIYIGLAFHGWYMWLYGGTNRTTLTVSHSPLRERIVMAFICVMMTLLLTFYLHSIKDSAPFLDAFTTVLSLSAQYLLNKKRIENWYLWITADVLYIGLYAYKGLYLTAVLYAVFIGMCIAGLLTWHRELNNAPTTNDMAIAEVGAK